MIINACPTCGYRVRNHCHHDGYDVSPVEMEIEEAIRLADGEVEMLEETLRRTNNNLVQLMRDLYEEEYEKRRKMNVATCIRFGELVARQVEDIVIGDSNET